MTDIPTARAQAPTADKTRRVRLLMTVALAGAVAACSLEPDYVKPMEKLPAAYRNDAGTDKATVPAPNSKWWENFGSKELDSLVERALANNRDLKGALARVVESEAQAKAARGSLYPTVAGVYNDQLVYPDAGIGIPERLGAQAESLRTTTVGLRAAYEFDFWGKNRSSIDVAVAEAQASEYDRQIVALTLVSDVISTYMLYLEMSDRTSLARDQAKNAGEIAKTVKALADVHEASRIDVAQQNTTLAQAKAQIPAYTIQKEQAHDRLAILLGIPPGDLTLTGTTIDELQVPAIAPGTPSDLLLRRPDIAKAEANLRAANANIGAARALYLPSFSLTTEAGRGSNYLADLLLPQNFYYNLVGNAVQLIFDGGKTDAQVALARAKYEELLQSYHSAIITALREVEDSLVAAEYLNDQQNAEEDALKTAIEANELSTVAYKAHSLDYLPLLESERTRFVTEDQIIQIRTQRLATAVALYKSLGGDVAPNKNFKEAAAPAEPTVKKQ
jgi:NodT family efflux transporter outer membrane factor (OMF) lipoprotein